MMVRCGACRTQFDVPGAGRFSCPNCGSVNMVRSAADAGPGPAPAPPPPGYGQPPPGYGVPPQGQAPQPQTYAPPPAAPEPPSPKLECPDCGFSFIVGAIEVATCPNCGNDVPTGFTQEQPE